MPVRKVTIRGKVGYRYGKSGKFYLGKSGKAKAAKQGRAIRRNQARRK